MTIKNQIKNQKRNSIIISSVLSGLFFLFIFGTKQPVPVWGMGNYVFDFAPQSFVITFMSCLVPGLTMRKSVLTGKFAGVNSFPTPPNIIGRAALYGVIAVICGMGAAAIIFKLVGITAIPAIAGLAIKLIYGGALGAFATGTFLNALLNSVKNA